MMRLSLTHCSNSSSDFIQYVNSEYNDVFGFFLNGENIAKIPQSDMVVAINNVNFDMNSDYYINNELVGGKSYTSPYPSIEADGLTKELTAFAKPVEGWNTIR